MLTQKQTNPFKYSDDNKRYHTLYYHNKHTFGKRMIKAVIDAGFTCPNIDGTKGYGGCTYCTSGAAEFALSSKISVSEQLFSEKERINAKYKNAGIIAYFQAHTNTYAPLEEIQRIYYEALSHSFVSGISIATRPDCLEDEKIDYLASLSEKTYLTVELGLQTANDNTGELINRRHSFSEFLSAYEKLKQNNIRVCVHIINGLPLETCDMMIDTAKTLGALKPDAVKIHLLHIMKNTVMEKQYYNGLINEMSFDDYVKTVCSQLLYLPPETVVERITGDGSKQNLIAPKWSTNKISVLGAIDKYLFDNNLFQGLCFYKM